ncbi:MAG: twin-arginine translocase subunit TatC [Thermoplasmatota archaeon]
MAVPLLLQALPGNGTAAPSPADGDGGGVLLQAVAAGILVLILAGVVWAVRRPPSETSPEMGWLEHAEELRRRILIALATWVGASLVTFSIRVEWTAAGWPVARPALQETLAAQAFRQLTEHLLPDNVQLVVTRPIDGFLAQLYLAFGIGFVVALPVIFVQAHRFLAPGLHEHERRALRRAFLPAMGLFAAGVAFCWYAVLPLLLRTLYGYSSALGAQGLIQVSELVSFTLTMLGVFGVSFQLPLVMYLLTRVGLVSAAGYQRYWRHAAIGILVFSAFATDPTLVSQALVAAPLILLYGLGIVAARRAEAGLRAAT